MEAAQEVASPRDRTRERIVTTAARLLREGGRDAVSTRAVCAEAGVQAPTIYRIFGDKRGLLDAVALSELGAWSSAEGGTERLADPVDDLRAGWDRHIAFGLAHPHVYPLVYGERQVGVTPPAIVTAGNTLRDKLHRIAEAGRLRVAEDRAFHLVHSTGSGVTLWLIGLPEDEKTRALATLVREMVIATITTDGPTHATPGAVIAAVALRAALPRSDVLTAAEATLMEEWLHRIAQG